MIDLSDKKLPKKKIVEPKKPISKKPEVPRANIGRMIKKNSKDSVGISTIKKAISEEDSWIGSNQLDFWRKISYFDLLNVYLFLMLFYEKTN